jgi:hypothetical protein
MTMRTIGVRQDAERLYAYLVAFVGDNGYAPRRCDMADDLSFTIHRLDRALHCLRVTGRIQERSMLPNASIKTDGRNSLSSVCVLRMRWLAAT